jgi:dihydroflavonol-4-reductase
MHEKGPVLVTGASGYIAGFVIERLVADGWRVRGTVRDPGKYGGLAAGLGLPPGALDLVAADLTSDAGWTEAATGCSHMIHVASPLPSGPKDTAEELTAAALGGALRALAAAKAAGIRRVVMTSSVAAICYGRDGEPPLFTEEHWTDPDHPDAYPYVVSKTRAERGARDWVAANAPDMEFVTINPSLVVGPLLTAERSTSLQAVEQLLGGKLPACPRIGFAVVDVRDVADLHVAAMTAPDMAGERFIAAGPFLWFTEIAAMLKARLGAKARKVPTRTMPDWLVRIAALFNPEVRMILSELGRRRDCDSGHAKTKLGWTPRGTEESLFDCVESLIASGVVKP